MKQLQYVYLSVGLAFVFLILSNRCSAQKVDAPLLSASLPRSGESGIVLPVLLRLSEGTYSFRVQGWQLDHRGDSIRLYDIVYKSVRISSAVQEHSFLLDKDGQRLYADPVFFEVLQRFSLVPPGSYVMAVTVRKGDSLFYNKQQLRQVDSVLAIRSGLRQKVNDLLGSDAVTGRYARKGKTVSDDDLRRSNRRLRSLRGVAARSVMTGGRGWQELYYKNWFIGRYEVLNAGEQQEKIAKEQSLLAENASSFVCDNLEEYQSLGVQLRSLYDKRREEREMSGHIEWNSTLACGTDPASRQDANYSEVYGNIGTEVLDIPVSIEGYYTTQDMSRAAKASYLRVRYDADKARQELLDLISAYRRKYGEVSAKGKGLEQVYGTYLHRIGGERQQLLGTLSREYSLSGDESDMLTVLKEQNRQTSDTADWRNQVLSQYKDSTRADSAYQVLLRQYQRGQKILRDTARLREQYKRLLALQAQAEKYRGLIRQYQEGMTLDSALHFAKLERLSQAEDASYKDLAKAASGLLPDGKLKKWSTGLSHLEGGILSRYESAYTQAGQTLKGLSIGYDFGFATGMLSGGRTEYISRDGQPERYSSYSLGLKFKELYGQRLGLIYYTSSASRELVRDPRFRNDATAIGSFVRPVHIGALTYEGRIGKNAELAGEVAISVHGPRANQALDMPHAAMKLRGQYRIERVNTTLKGEWEHVGLAFENPSLPLSRTGTERYKAGVELNLFRSFLHLGLSWNYLVQDNYSSRSVNRRWGFDLKTRSKRYPNLSLSYKPFSTFRAYDDTLSVPQRPLSGAVWTGRGSYQLKRGKQVHRFSVLYSRNSTDDGDTLRYRSWSVQGTYCYARDGVMLNTAAGLTELPGLPSSGLGGSYNGYVGGKTCFVNIGGSRTVGRVGVQLSEDIGFAAFGLQRLSTTCGGSYRMEKLGVQVRATVRYTDYRESAVSSRHGLWAGQVGMGWDFKIKLRERRD